MAEKIIIKERARIKFQLAVNNVPVPVNGGGGEENVIETISINETNIPPVNKNVDIPLKTVGGVSLVGVGDIPISDVAPEFSFTFDKTTAQWFEGWLMIPHGSRVNVGKKVVDTKLTVVFGSGTKELNAIVNYPAWNTYNEGEVNSYQGFYLRDTMALLREDSDFESIEFSYNIEVDTVKRYDTLVEKLGNNAVHDAYRLTDTPENIALSLNHSAKCKQIFDYFYPDFEGENIESILDQLTHFGDSGVFYEGVMNEYLPTYLRLKGADISYRSEVDAPRLEEVASNPNILTVGSHYNNTNFRRDITADANTFLKNSIAVAAGNIDITNQSSTSRTSYGFGVEFFEDMALYTAKDIYSALVEFLTADGETVYSTVHPNWTNSTGVQVGDTITYQHNGIVIESRIVSEIVSASSVKVSVPFTPMTTAGRYLWGMISAKTWLTLYPDGHGTQSWATPIVAAKLKQIKDATGASWDIVRLAARSTGSNNGVWDMYRGFGIVDVQAAIDLIGETDYSSILAQQYNDSFAISEMVTYEDLMPNSPISKKFFEENTPEITETDPIWNSEKSNYQTKTDNSLNTTSNDVVGAINEVRGLALEIPIGLVFATKAALDLWLTTPANKASLKNSQNLLIIDVNTPDYWWDYAAQIYHELEAKLDLSGYYTSAQVDTLLGSKQNTLTFSTDIEADKASTTKVSAIKTFFDWAVGKFATITDYFTKTDSDRRFVAQNGGVVYHPTAVTTTGTISTNGVNCAGVGTIIGVAMVGAKIIINGEERIIATRTNNTSFTVNASFSQNYVAQTFAVYIRFYAFVADTVIFYDYTGGEVFKILNNGTYSFSGIGGYFYNTLALAKSAIIKWSNTSDPLATKEAGVGINSSGVVEINNGTAGQFRDLKLRMSIETGLSEYADNAAALAAGLTVGTHYRTGDLLKIVH